MPRISPSLVRKALSIDKFLPPLLPVCRDLHSAQNELRWLKEHAWDSGRNADNSVLLKNLVWRRSQGEPLQYILGTEYFGALEIKCRPGVLIPRQDTAASVTHLVNLISKNNLKSPTPDKLGVLDLCTGSGCIPLLFHHEFYSNLSNTDKRLKLTGVDISSQALSLASENLRAQIQEQRQRDKADGVRRQSLEELTIIRGDVLATAKSEDSSEIRSAIEALRSIDQIPSYDILISNPPYISPKAFRTTTARSVRTFEPRLALVPDNSTEGDIFYPRLLDAADDVQAKVLLFEVADLKQAKRVATMTVAQGSWETVEIWLDDPSPKDFEEFMIDNRNIKIRGAGNGRSVFAYRGAAADWLRE